MDDEDDDIRPYASPACMLHELSADFLDVVETGPPIARKDDQASPAPSTGDGDSAPTNSPESDR